LLTVIACSVDNTCVKMPKSNTRQYSFFSQLWYSCYISELHKNGYR